MVIDHKSPIHDDMQSRLYDTVALGKVSSLEMISNLVGIEEKSVRETIETLIEEGSLEGTFTADGKRFFQSDVKVSDAPKAGIQDKGLEMKSADTRSAKAIALTGFVMLILGQILRSLIAIHPGMETVGTAIFLLGLVILFAGGYQFSRLNPVTNV